MQHSFPQSRGAMVRLIPTGLHDVVLLPHDAGTKVPSAIVKHMKASNSTPGMNYSASTILLEVRHFKEDHHHNAVVPPRTMHTVRHDKDAGEGYQHGSPLYSKQQTLKSMGDGQSTTVLSPAAEPPVVKATNGMAQHTNLLLTCMVYIVLLVSVAYIYKQVRKPQPRLLTAPYPGERFTFGFFDPLGFQDWSICLMACCCPAIRWAETVSDDKVQYMTFWAALFLVLGLGISIFVLGFYVLGHVELAPVICLIFVLLGIYFRQRLRLTFGHNPYVLRSVAIDILSWCCCPCCAIVQEAREVTYCQTAHNGMMSMPPSA